MSYTLQDYHNIKSAFVLPESVLAIISSLASNFGATLVVESKPKNKPLRRGCSDQWQTEFKPTVVLDKGNKNNDIRISLNKLSVKNYETTSAFLIEKIRELEGEETTTFFATLLEVISTNKMFSHLYAKFYKTLITEFPDLFSNTLDTILTKYVDSISTIHCIDQKDNYDEFCKNNKENDRRKTIAAFITNLNDIGLVTDDQLFFMTTTILDNVFTLIKEDNKIYEVEEITENIYVLMTQQKNMLSKIPSLIQERISELSQKKAKEDPSISSRAIFKYMDLVEKMMKN